MDLWVEINRSTMKSEKDNETLKKIIKKCNATNGDHGKRFIIYHFPKDPKGKNALSFVKKLIKKIPYLTVTIGHTKH